MKTAKAIVFVLILVILVTSKGENNMAKIANAMNASSKVSPKNAGALSTKPAWVQKKANSTIREMEEPMPKMNYAADAPDLLDVEAGGGFNDNKPDFEAMKKLFKPALPAMRKQVQPNIVINASPFASNYGGYGGGGGGGYGDWDDDDTPAWWNRYLRLNSWNIR